MADPWVITPMEKLRHNEQFLSLHPVGGFISGEQAKAYLLRSTLPPQILGIIWMLSDLDGDGKMNQVEFSIACKLTSMKLRGVNLPTSLPPSLRQSAMMQQPSVVPPAVPASPLVSSAIPPQQTQVASAPVGIANNTSSTTYSASTPPKPPIQDPSANEWGIPQASKLKFTQVFNMSDRTKTGFISGIQARNILIQAALPQATLAKIWTLSDVDNDGRLSCEEFVLALYLCEQAKAGKAVPSVLPPDLIPPSLRRSRTSSIQSQGSVGTGEVSSSSTPQLMSENSFEDKRKENYEKGQAELERRRKALMDAQRREMEERMRREREDEMKREKARQEAERKRQEELEIEMMRQKEIENQKEMERKRMEEMKEDARKEAERQRQDEWEKQRLLELMNVRQRHQENLLALKAKNQSLTIELTTKEDKIKEITQSISETRTNVTDVKAAIDGMRNTRDEHMSNMNALKAQAKDQNQRLLNLNQEKARLKARSLASAGASGAETAAVEASITSKQLVIKQLQDKIKEIQEELNTKEQDVNNNLTEFQSAKDQFILTGERCSELYEEYIVKHKKVLALREKLLNPDTAWGDSGDTSWKDKNKVAIADAVITEGRTFHALYQFDARNEDELTLLPGDIVVEIPTEGNEPGWLSGNLNGKIGWFPEAYCELAEGEVGQIGHPTTITSQASVTSVKEVEPVITEAVSSKRFGEMVVLYSWSGFKNNHLSLNKGDKINVKGALDQWLYGELNGIEGWFPESYVKDPTTSVMSPVQAPAIPPLPEQINHDDISQFYLAVYPYTSEEPGDLVFEAGETMIVVKKEGDWWYGVIEDRNGIFPSNYVQIVPNQSVAVKKTENEIVPPKTDEKQPESDFDMSGQTQSDSDHYKDPLQEKTKKLAVAQVIAPYDATTPNQLSLVRGQLVSIRKKTSSGWWEGELHAKGKKREVGWFPASYVKILCGSSRTTPVSMEVSGKSDEEPGGFTQRDLADAFSNKAISMDQKVNYIPRQEPEVVEALYPYTAVNDDELTFKAGDQIFVIDKEDSAWWKGSLKGVIGVFPSNYVKVKSEAKVIEKPITITSPDADDSLC